jgi:hypothetical protein
MARPGQESREWLPMVKKSIEERRANDAPPHHADRPFITISATHAQSGRRMAS